MRVKGQIVQISIHALLAESDEDADTQLQNSIEFLSTLSLRRATFRPCDRQSMGPDFYPRSPCGERPRIIDPTYGQEVFLSTLSLRRATGPLSTLPIGTVFLSTLSLRRATGTHTANAPAYGYFYPRSPCGERRGDRKADVRNSLFLSTLSLRRATSLVIKLPLRSEISIHALLAESDAYRVQLGSMVSISIHALLAESDLIFAARHMTVRIFLSTLSLRRATSPNGGQYNVYSISIHALLAESDCRTERYF